MPHITTTSTAARPQRTLPALLAGSLLLAAAAADARPLRISATGVAQAAAELDIDGDGAGSSATGSGRGTLGPVTTVASFDLAAWDGFSSCDIGGEPTDGGFGFGNLGQLRTWAGGDAVVQTEGGEQVWLTLDPAAASTACVDPADGTATLSLAVLVRGGTGRYRGATGAATVTGNATALRPGFVSFGTTLRGNIELVRRRGHD